MKLLSQTSWEIYPLLAKAQFAAADAAQVEPLHAQILHNRGIETPEQMKTFIEAAYDKTPDPFTLIDMPLAVDRIVRAIHSQEHITVYGDYDADGVTSSSLLFRALRTLKHPKAALDHYIPHRLHDGCGLHLPALDQLHARGTTLIITTDCGSSDLEQVAYASTLGIDVIITDHHHPPIELPQAYAMVNPWRPECDYECQRYLCGVGIAFKLAQALYRACNRPQEEELALLDLVAVGTVADIVPLIGENHTLVRLGMQRLNTTQNPGLKALIRSANLQPGRIRERDIAYSLAPRINAAGRMKNASIAFELLVTNSEEEATALVAQLDQLNMARQQETETLMRNVRTQAQHYPTDQVVLVSGDDWHEGIIGLVAGKLADEINKPVLVVSNDPGTRLSRGSARSRKGFNMIEALRSFGSSLERYGGHSQAAGFTIQSERIEDLRRHLLAWRGQDGESMPVPIGDTKSPDQTDVVTEQDSTSLAQMVDLIFTKMDLLTYSLYKKIRLLSPFGASNPEPIFKMEGVRLLDKWASGIHGQNLRLKLGSITGNIQRSGTLTKGAAQLQSLTTVSHVNVIFRVESSEDEARQEIWLKILHVEPAG